MSRKSLSVEEKMAIVMAGIKGEAIYSEKGNLRGR